MDFLYAVIITFGLRHSAPLAYHAPVKTLPLIIESDPSPLGHWKWGAPCGSEN